MSVIIPGENRFGIEGRIKNKGIYRVRKKKRKKNRNLLLERMMKIIPGKKRTENDGNSYHGENV